MGTKKPNVLRGWFPNEPQIHSHCSAADPKDLPIVRWTARAFLIGAVADAVLLVFGDLAGWSSGFNAYLWPVAVFGVTFGPVAAVPFLVKRKTGQSWED